MKRQFIPVEKAFREWEKDPEFKAAYDALEDELLTSHSYELRPKIAEIRRAAIGLRRYLAPQRDVMARLHNEKVDWLSEIERMRLREIADRTARFVEDLDDLNPVELVTRPLQSLRQLVIFARDSPHSEEFLIFTKNKFALI